MPKQKIHFRGFLTNTDSSILDVTLKHDFKIEDNSFDDAVEFVKTVEKTTLKEASQKLTSDYPCLNSQKNKVYFISNSFALDLNLKNKVNLFSNKSFSSITEFASVYVHNYLVSVIRLMRLFKEGNIYMPFEYFFFFENDVPIQFLGKKKSIHISRTPILSLEKSEIKELEHFIHNTKLPFNEEPLQLAFESFELSYHIVTLGMQFLLLMMSIESLFNPSGQCELKYRISRNTAVLIGKDKDDSQAIYEKMKELYNTRSKFIHTGKSNLISEEDVLVLCDFARRSIKIFYEFGKGKDYILEILNSSGFGDKSWLQKEMEAQKIDDR